MSGPSRIGVTWTPPWGSSAPPSRRRYWSAPLRQRVNDRSDGLRVASVGLGPGAPEPEHPRVAAQAFADMDADIEVKADLDVLASVGLTHPRTNLGRRR